MMLSAYSLQQKNEMEWVPKYILFHSTQFLFKEIRMINGADTLWMCLVFIIFKFYLWIETRCLFQISPVVSFEILFL